MRKKWKKEDVNEDLTLYLSWKEREIDGVIYYYLFCKKNRISTSLVGKRNRKELVD